MAIYNFIKYMKIKPSQGKNQIITAPKFYIKTLGCKVNQYDSNKLRMLLRRAGFIESQAGADLLILNTCAVTLSAISKDRQALKVLRAGSPRAKLVVMGCWPQTYKPALPVDLVWGTGNLEQLAVTIKEKFNFSLVPNLESGFASSDRSRYFLKVGDGCNQFCSYCIIPFARGRIKSRPIKELLAEITEAVSHGFKEIILSGIHLGRYGEDFKGQGVNLVALLESIIKIPGLGRVRLSSIEINELSDELINFIKNNNKICRHLHISLQSGSDKILGLMKRPYTADYFRKKVEAIKKLIPEMALSTDIIVGFPSETKKDFLASYFLAKDLAFSKIHVFSFSAHPQTAAFKLRPRVPQAEIKDRSTKLRQLSLKLEKKYKSMILKKYKGKSLAVIIDHKNRGKTEFHFDLDLKGRQAKVGSLVTIDL